MTYDDFVRALINVQLTCKDDYTAEYHADIERKSAQFNTEAYQRLQAIQGGSAWGATIVLESDFELINGTLTNAGVTIEASNPCYQEVADMIKAILPDDESRNAFDKYTDAKSSIYSTFIKKPWTPVRIQITLFGLTWGEGSGWGEGSVMMMLSCI